MTTYIATGELTSLTEAHLIGVLSNVINSYHYSGYYTIGS